MSVSLQPRILRAGIAPCYCGMSRAVFDQEIRPYLVTVPIGVQGLGFDRLDIDRALDEYISRRGRAVVNRQRGLHSSRVFTYKGSPVASIDNSAWRRARKVARLEQVRVHDLRHTFGRRLRATGVSSELRAELLGHASGSITTHYSSAEVTELLEAVELIAEKRGPESDGVAVVKLRGVHKMPTSGKKKTAR